MKTIHVIMAISQPSKLKHENGKKFDITSHHNMGMMEDRQEAIEAVLKDTETISDFGSMPYVVVEEVSLNTIAGSTAPKNQTWFEFNNEEKKYELIEGAPDHLKNIVYFSIM